jgi:tRNA A37 threonylcarbamoyladenosine modification protein TsaB
VAYINGLAFSLGIPIFTANSLRLLAFDASAAFGNDEFLALRRAGADTVYAGRFRGTELAGLSFGQLDQTVRTLGRGCDKLVIAGSFRDEVAELVPEIEVIDSGIGDSDARALARLWVAGPEPLATVLVASPLTEMSPEFLADGAEN